MLLKKSCTALLECERSCQPKKKYNKAHCTKAIEREWEMERGKRLKTVNKSNTENTRSLIGGDLSTPTYMSAHIFDWMNDCSVVVRMLCTFRWFVNIVQVWIQVTRAIITATKRNNQKKNNRSSFFSLCTVFFFIWLTSIYIHTKWEAIVWMKGCEFALQWDFFLLK